MKLSGELIKYRDEEKKRISTKPLYPIVDTIETLTFDEARFYFSYAKATESSIRNLKAVYHVMGLVKDFDGLLTAFIYGSTPKGTTDKYKHYDELRYFKKGLLEKVVFTESLNNNKKSDLDIAFFVHNNSKFKNYLIPALNESSKVFNEILFDTRIISLEGFLENLGETSSLVKRVLSYNPVIIISCKEQYNVLKGLSDEAESMNGNFNMNVEAELRTIKKLQSIMETNAINELEIKRDDYANIFPALLLAADGKIGDGLPRSYADYIKIPDYPSRIKRKEQRRLF